MIAYYAGGCFWGLERYLKSIDGVTATTVGYAQSTIENPTYQQVCDDLTDAAETVRVEFDPDAVLLLTLTRLYIDAIDPFSINRQGTDEGRQYRSGMYYTDDTQKAVYDRVLEQLEFRQGRRPATEVEPLRNFYPAEDYHQDYLDKNPGGHCHIAIDKIMHVRERQKLIDRIWSLNAQQYAVTQLDATEPPYENEYDQTFEPGIYVDVVSGEPLFLSTDKFEAGCGWPAFSKPIDASSLTEHLDERNPKRIRTEIRTAKSQIHLGHVFEDGPKERGGLRYCMNSAALRFVPKADMAAQGYAKYLPLLEQ
ncbi:peptide-methionine (S)-S-oxide reductase MsrA [Bifidobacterium jacchi]|uniref:Peptide methionine sulfoxide reductase MsrA n=1 Tax=Bifidobacterium jacchi TaxID=2490545 RepID=A0A5N5RMV9_9BIFI|nr:peptide-methionine (S)-S-oxide reductase MsrA [Bifidobacterium jacchi]KAB5608289.1 peptide-methionine (S)-S-oxide reductase [Bifidobacterium jacchi]